MKIRIFTSGVIAGFCAFVAMAFQEELLLVSEAQRPRVLSALEARGRADEAALYSAAWQEDVEAFACAAQASLAAKWDRSLARFLHRQLVRAGRTEAAAAVAAELAARKCSARLLSVPAPSTYELSGRRPVVFLHGYSGDATTWTDFVRLFKQAGYAADDLLVFQYYDTDDNSRGAATGLTTFDYDTDKDIAKIASRVAKNTRIWLRRRAGHLDDDASHDAELPAPDFICHSMGGLVFRCLYSAEPALVHRCVDLGTPHFGQNISSSWTGLQTKQMKYGSSFLWSLAEDWFYRGKACAQMIFIVGAGENNSDIVDRDVVWDGLVCAFSSTLLTLADPDYASRTFFVNRTHSSIFDYVYDHPGLPTLSGLNDPIFKLSYGYLNDSHYFANGAVPDWTTVLRDDVASANRAENILGNVTRHGGLFVQVRHPTTNTVSKIQKAIKYDPGTFYPDDVVEYLKNVDTGVAYKSDTNGCYWEHGNSDEGCTNGLVQIYGNLPPGDYKMKIEEPSKSAPNYKFPYTTTVTIYGGGTRLVRTRPGAVEPKTATRLTDDKGTLFDVIVPNAWLASAGVVASAEDLEGCVAAGGMKFANGYTAAESYWLQLDPTNATSTLAFSAITAGDEVALQVRAGETVLLPEKASAASASRTTWAKYVVQTKDTLEDPWRDAAGLFWTTGEGLWRFPVSSGRFFRIVARP